MSPLRRVNELPWANLRCLPKNVPLQSLPEIVLQMRIVRMKKMMFRIIAPHHHQQQHGFKNNYYRKDVDVYHDVCDKESHWPTQ